MEQGSQAPEACLFGHVSGVLMGAGVLGQRKVQPLKTSGCARFRGGAGKRKAQLLKTSSRARFRGGAGKRKAQPPKTSSCARFWEVWVVVLARGGSNP